METTEDYSPFNTINSRVYDEKSHLQKPRIPKHYIAMQSV